MRAQAIVHLAVTKDGRMPFPYGDDLLQQIHTLCRFPKPLVVEGATREQAENAALNTAWREANIGEQGWAERYRDARNRSLSIGDVVAVHVEGDPHPVHWLCTPDGWDDVTDRAVSITVTDDWWGDVSDRLAAAQ